MTVARRKLRPPKAMTQPAQRAGAAPSVRLQASNDEDFYRWAFEQAALVRANRSPDLDVENIAEELESLGRQEFDKLETTLTVILLNMLVWDQRSERRSRSRASTIQIQRRRYDKVLKTSPSLSSRGDEALADAYEIARLTASSETDLPLRMFPSACPYSWSDVIDRPFAIDPDDA